ncbi:histidine kinase [Oscillatoria nigro-viridis PCC 7112]|uniref:histidine kinase n=1 Tax=Phormidium nigroviride PCC 7112 TaxID=179408 RepID=K9VH14_9CYAN|nr:sensor histidine kinase [Oscillatoria nigro-viridis]AFZ07241.1 histidine kinase [Oscillatoria nigro-viridis PCC 7112]
MIDFSQALQDKIDIIVQNWIEAVRADEQIETAKQLTYTSVRDRLPIALQAIVTLLSGSEESDLRTLIEESLDHGTVRAQQGYDAEEIAREYRLLRRVIFDVLEPELLQGSAAEVSRAYRLIDTALDEVIADCFKTYTQARFQELQDLQNQLQLTNQELTRLLRASQENLSHLAHELKTPLNSIIGYSELFLRQRNNSRVKDSVPNLAHIDKVLNNGRRLLRLINDSLEISRYDTGRIKLQLTATNVRSAIGTVVEIIEPLAKAKNLEIAVECDPVLDRIMTDYLRLQQIITNLASNAIRYTQAGTVTIKSELLPDKYWTVTVSDTGIGIAPEDCERIFQPYFRADNSLSSGIPDSTGLGLAIVARLVKLLQGKIELVSEVGVGSSFTVIFPLELE